MRAVLAKVMGGAMGLMALLAAHHASADMLGGTALKPPAPVVQNANFSCGSSLGRNEEMEQVSTATDHDVAILRDVRLDQMANRLKTIPM